MEPYTVEGVNKRESFAVHDDSDTNTNGNSNHEILINATSTTTTGNLCFR
jgi:hypothetical protein